MAATCRPARASSLSGLWDDILAAVDEIEGDYPGNCRAARQIAEEYFSAEKVVGSLMARAGL